MSNRWSCKSNQDAHNFTSIGETTRINGMWVGKQIHGCALIWKSCKYNLKAHCKFLLHNALCFYHLIHGNIQRTPIITLALASWHSSLN